VPHVHVHLIPLDAIGDLNFANADPNPKPAALDARGREDPRALRELGYREVADSGTPAAHGISFPLQGEKLATQAQLHRGARVARLFRRVDERGAGSRRLRAARARVAVGADDAARRRDPAVQTRGPPCSR
jgi:hypothetical protein